MILYRVMGNPVVTLGSGLPDENFPDRRKLWILLQVGYLALCSIPMNKWRPDALTLKDIDFMHRERDLKISLSSSHFGLTTQEESGLTCQGALAFIRCIGLSRSWPLWWAGSVCPCLDHLKTTTFTPVLVSPRTEAVSSIYPGTLRSLNE